MVKSQVKRGILDKSAGRQLYMRGRSYDGF